MVEPLFWIGVFGLDRDPLTGVRMVPTITHVRRSLDRRRVDVTTSRDGQLATA